jgi:hypothetical protein
LEPSVQLPLVAVDVQVPSAALADGTSNMQTAIVPSGTQADSELASLPYSEKPDVAQDRFRSSRPHRSSEECHPYLPRLAT